MNGFLCVSPFFHELAFFQGGGIEKLCIDPVGPYGFASSLPITLTSISRCFEIVIRVDISRLWRSCDEIFIYIRMKTAHGTVSRLIQDGNDLHGSSSCVRCCKWDTESDLK